VSFCSPAKLQILDINGTILQSFEDKHFIYPYYVTSNRTSIYVSDRSLKTVSKLNWQGQLIDIYRGLRKPSVMSLMDNGDVLVSDEKRNVIEKISEDFSTAKVLLDDLNDPYAICYCSKARKLFVSCYTLDPNVDNVIQIYKLT
jgi:hypothetical protein